jgi:hypothetical protein
MSAFGHGSKKNYKTSGILSVEIISLFDRFTSSNLNTFYQMIILITKLTKYSVDGVSVPVNQCCHDIHHPEDDKREQNQSQNRLLGSRNQTLKEKVRFG